jgi:hypothetical protein
MAHMHVPAEYLCTMCETSLRLLGEAGQLDDLCARCLGEMNRQRAVEARHVELLDLAEGLVGADGSCEDRQLALARLLQLVVEWPELVEALAEQLANFTAEAVR